MKYLQYLPVFVAQRQDKFRQRCLQLGVNFREDILNEMAKTYIWPFQVEQILNSPADLLKLLVIGQIPVFPFLENSVKALNLRQKMSAAYFKSFYPTEVLGQEFPILLTPEHVQIARSSGQLVVLELDWLMYEVPLVVHSQIQGPVSKLLTSLEGFGMMFKITSSTRSVAESNLLRELGYAVLPPKMGVNPSTKGLAFSMALTGSQNEGAYSKFLKSLSNDGRNAYQDAAKRKKVAPSLNTAISNGWIGDMQFMQMWQVLNSKPNFRVFDLTPLYSGRGCNPAWVVIAKL